MARVDEMLQKALDNIALEGRFGCPVFSLWFFIDADVALRRYLLLRLADMAPDICFVQERNVGEAMRFLCKKIILYSVA